MDCTKYLVCQRSTEIIIYLKRFLTEMFTASGVAVALSFRVHRGWISWASTARLMNERPTAETCIVGPLLLVRIFLGGPVGVIIPLGDDCSCFKIVLRRTES